MSDQYNELVSLMAAAINNGSALPKMPADLDLPSAYKIQQALVSEIGPKIAGLKAGVTTANVQKYFGLDHALLGRLYESGRMQSGATLNLRNEGVGLSLECEIGIVIDANGQALSAGPAIEVVCLAFSDPKDMNPANLVACNLGAQGFILGEQLAWRDQYDDIKVRLTRDGELLNEASMSESFGSPKSALNWMCSEARQQGIELADNMLLMTGTCGGVIPAKPGHYVADYGDLGRIEFDVVVAA